MKRKRIYTLDEWKKVASPHVLAQLEALEQTKPKKNKFNAKKVIEDGIKFDSKKEYARYQELKQWQELGIISDLERQVTYVLIEATEGERRCAYVSDFRYTRDGGVVVEDVKSVATRKLPVYVIKRKLMLERYGIKIHEV